MGAAAVGTRLPPAVAPSSVSRLEAARWPTGVDLLALSLRWVSTNFCREAAMTTAAVIRTFVPRALCARYRSSSGLLISPSTPHSNPWNTYYSLLRAHTDAWAWSHLPKIGSRPRSRAHASTAPAWARGRHDGPRVRSPGLWCQLPHRRRERLSNSLSLPQFPPRAPPPTAALSLLPDHRKHRRGGSGR